MVEDMAWLVDVDVRSVGPLLQPMAASTIADETMDAKGRCKSMAALFSKADAARDTHVCLHLLHT